MEVGWGGGGGEGAHALTFHRGKLNSLLPCLQVGDLHLVQVP